MGKERDSEKSEDIETADAEDASETAEDTEETADDAEDNASSKSDGIDFPKIDDLETRARASAMATRRENERRELRRPESSLVIPATLKKKQREPSIRIVLNPTPEDLIRSAPKPIARALNDSVLGQAILCGVLIGVAFLISGFQGRLSEIWTVAVAVSGCVSLAFARWLTREPEGEEPNMHSHASRYAFEIGAWALVGWSFARITVLLAPEEAGTAAAVLLLCTFVIGELFRHSVRLRDDLGRAILATIFIGAPFFTLVALMTAFYLEPDNIPLVAAFWGIASIPLGEMVRWVRRKELAPVEVQRAMAAEKAAEDKAAAEKTAAG